MAKRLKEQIDYGNRPERMDPEFERYLGSPEGIYAQNPAMRKGVQDVQRLASARFNKLADKLKQVTGRADISGRDIQGMLYQEMMSRVPRVLSIEGRNREALEQLAIEASLEDSEVPEGWFEIRAFLNRAPIDVSKFRYRPDEDEDEEEQDDEQENELNIPSFDLEDLTPQEELELEKHKRNMLNAIIQGAAKKGHYSFQKPEIREKLNQIDPSLYDEYLFIMAVTDFMYFTKEQMIKYMSETGNGVAGMVELKSKDDDDDDDGGGEGEYEDKPDTIIEAHGLMFPILCHEIIKGLQEAIARHGLPQDPEMAQKVMGQTDLLRNEPIQLRIGPEIVEKIRFALPDEMFEPENKGLITWFNISLYKIPAKEFLEIIGNAISADNDRIKKATSRFEEIMKEAMELKSEFEAYQEEHGGDESDNNDSGDEDDDIDDFLNSLGIYRPD